VDDLIIDFVQQRRVRGGRPEASRGKPDAADARPPPLEEQLGRLTLACTAMWTLLRQRLGMTDPELLEAIQEVDLRDGVLDGQYKPPALTCPACGRRNNRRRRACMYCESPLPEEPRA
jgi:hypothetical protein